MIKSKLFPPMIVDFILSNVKGLYNKELADLVNSTFNTNYTASQIESFKNNHHISSGLTGYYEKGHVPANKGKKMSKEIYEKCSKTMFKKGNKPLNFKPLGSERLTKDGYVEVKIELPNRWQLKHRYIWEQHNGKIPKNHIVIFLNQDKTDIRIENIVLISQAENLKMNRNKRFSEHAEITKNGILVTKLDKAIYKKLNKQCPRPNKRIAEAGELFEQGLSITEIMQAMNIARSTCRYYLKLYQKGNN